jgi:modulator of FtsH protease
VENLYQAELWRDLYVMVGSSSAALVGLLFIATSLHLDEFVKYPAFRRRAYTNTRNLLITFVEAALILIPQQMPILGAELLALNLIGLCFVLINIYKFFYPDKDDFGRPPGWLYRVTISIICFLLGIVGGAVLIAHLNLGIYLVTVSCITLLVAVVLNAWSIMLGVGQAENRAKTN